MWLASRGEATVSNTSYLSGDKWQLSDVKKLTSFGMRVNLAKCTFSVEKQHSPCQDPYRERRG
jgi:hypothetical protein